MVSRERKVEFMARLSGLIEKYDRIVLVDADNVSSAQMNSVRKSLRGHGELIMGKNTIMRKVMRTFVGKKAAIEELIPMLAGNLGLIFTNEDVKDIREIVYSHKQGAPARVGAIAPLDVFIPAGPTGCEPTQTSFFAALAIPTMINKGAIDITEDVHLIKEGEKVGSSEAALLQKLNMRPFSYSLDFAQIYDNGVIFSPKVLDITPEDIVENFRAEVEKIAKISLATGLLTVASVPLLVREAMANVVKVSVVSGHAIEQTETMLEFLSNPEEFLAKQAAAAPAKEEKKEVAAESESDSESSDMGFGGMF